jgi:hypothetical protein
MGVKESHPKSRSIFLLLKLSTMTTSWPRSDRYSDVGQPQKPSPPKTITFFFFFDGVAKPFRSSFTAGTADDEDDRGSCVRSGCCDSCCRGDDDDVVRPIQPPAPGEKDSAAIGSSTATRTTGRTDDDARFWGDLMMI